MILGLIVVGMILLTSDEPWAWGAGIFCIALALAYEKTKD